MSRTASQYNKKRKRLIEEQIKQKGYNWCTLCYHPVYSSKEVDFNHYAMLTIDHIIPVSEGGRNSIDNLRVCCRACNLARTKK